MPDTDQIAPCGGATGCSDQRRNGAILLRLKPLIAAGLFFCSLFLRTDGLSHDLHHGRVYHPDTPKQIRAVERFLDDQYYVVMGGRDYDGYPLFNSHLVEFIVRAYQGPARWIHRHLGASGGIENPSYLALFWITRVLNAVLSAAAVLLVFLLGWRFVSPAAGLAAGLLLALSPADIVACHYANGDSAAAFFALAGIGAALTITRRPVWWAYVLAGLFAAAAFSSKYHGGMALAGAVIAHIGFFGRQRRLLTRESVSRALLLCFAFIGGVFLTSPALLVFPKSAWHDIVAFFKYTASFGMSEDMRNMSTLRRFQTGMLLNMPVLVDVVGTLPALGAVLALWIGRRKTVIWVLASVPLLYILLGLATKPLAHPVYHTMATPGIMLLAGYTWDRLLCGRRALALRRLAAVVLLLFAVAYLARYTQRELFFFRHNDSRHLIACWASDNIPASFDLHAARYTLSADAWRSGRVEAAGGAPTGSAYIYSGRPDTRIPEGALPVYTLEPEDDKLTPFRNAPQHVVFADAPSIRRIGPRPGFQPIPSPHDINLIDADAPWWIRHAGSFRLDEGASKSGALMTRRRPARAGILLRGGPEPSLVRLAFGGHDQTARLEAGESAVIVFEHPRPLHLKRVQRFFFDWRAAVRFGSARITVLTEPRDLAWACFNIGDYAGAIAWTGRCPSDELSPGDRILHGISALALGRQPDTNAWIQPKLPIDLAADYGLSSAYLDALPAFSWHPGRWSMVTGTPRSVEADTTHAVLSPPLALEPGVYTLTVEADRLPEGCAMVLTDAMDRPLEIAGLDAAAKGTLGSSFSVGPDDGFVRIRIQWDEGRPSPSVRLIRLQPDVEGTLQAYAALLAFMRDPARTPCPTHRMTYRPLLHFGEALEAQGDIEGARAVFQAAVRAAPDRRFALERLSACSGRTGNLPDDIAAYGAACARDVNARVLRPVHARFRTGLDLIGYQLSDSTVRVGQSFGLLTHWRPDTLRPELRYQAVWLHAIQDGGERAVFYGDTGLTNLLRLARSGEDARSPAFMRIRVPPDTPPGTYALKAGVYIPAQRKRIKVAETDLKHDKRGVWLTRIEVVP